MNAFAKIRKLLASHSPLRDASAFKRQAEAFQASYSLVRIFYVGQLLFCMRVFDKWSDWQQSQIFMPLWPLRWAAGWEVSQTANLLVGFWGIGVFLALFWPRVRHCRIFSFLGVFFIVAFYNSFGKIYHHYHLWVYASFLLIFLPSGTRSQLAANRTLKQIYLTVILGVQAMILLSYTLAGFWKVASSVKQFFAGEVSYFSINGMAYVVALRIVDTSKPPALSDLVLSWPQLGWLIVITAIYVECFALLVLYRPSLHRLWGIGLIAMHLGIGLVMGIHFRPAILLLVIWFIFSPFHPKHLPLRKTLADLPLLGFVFRFVGKR